MTVTASPAATPNALVIGCFSRHPVIRSPRAAVLTVQHIGAIAGVANAIPHRARHSFATHYLTANPGDEFGVALHHRPRQRRGHRRLRALCADDDCRSREQNVSRRVAERSETDGAAPVA